MMDLGDFLRREMASGAPWNCSTMPADWCVTRGHPDFAAAWRDTVDPAACDAAQDVPGGLLALWEAGIGDALPTADVLEPGDIAVVSLAGAVAGAIWTGERFAIRAARRVHFVPPGAMTVLRAWRP